MRVELTEKERWKIWYHHVCPGTIGTRYGTLGTIPRYIQRKLLRNPQVAAADI